jgi:putative spermidine/putrescine transport system permease protein
MSTQSSTPSLGRILTLVPSSFAIGVFFVIPFALILLTSIAHQQTSGDFIFGFDTAHYERFFTSIFMGRAIYSAGLSFSIAVISLLIAFPFTYALTRFTKRTRTIWLVYILAQLSLSEVLIAFSWQILFSRTAGISNLPAWLGLIDGPFSMAPSAGAVLVGLVYLALPFAVLLLFPALSRLDRSLIEASHTLGASPVRTFFTVVLPVSRPALISGGVTVFVLTLGAIIVPQVLGRPGHWTLSVLITDQAVYNSNMPFAAALAVILLLMSGTVIGVVGWLNRGSGK